MADNQDLAQHQAAKGTTTDRQNSTTDDMNAGTGATGNTTAGSRPILDSDIIDGNVAANTPSTSYTTNQAVMPGGTGTRNPVTPGSTSTVNPVVPADTGTVNPVMPPESGTTDPVMPPESGTTNPVMPPERSGNS